ncbi:MAG: mevalonate kinase [Thaumarchaeota archaeon]|nr:mevalonate kinase [Nitrososphaerota archaeon]
MKICAAAPGKIILAGEHFVVWGSTALAAAIDKSVTASAELANEDEIISENYGTRSKIAKGVGKGLYPIAKAIYATKEHLSSKKQVRVTIKSDIPPSSGLGSSSAVAVATVASVGKALGTDLSKRDIFDLAMESERIVHGNPSGIDVAVSVYGGILLYRKGEPPKEVKVEECNAVVGLSGLSRRTAKMISRVAEVRKTSPNFFNALVASSSRLSMLASKSMEKGDFDDLASVMTFHNSTLSWLGLAIPTTDEMIEICLENGALVAKITGGGGGGAIISIPKQGKAQDVVKALKSRGFDAFLVKLPQQGLKVWEE